MHYVIGTAGHIDHGKSAVVRALTGTDPDRLKEEQERGMTTDLGFAFLGDEITIIDVPGHERFVRHMLAGASTIDLVMLVVAADDGVMPQTREHFEICRLLGIKKGLVVINKIDLVDRDWLEMVRRDICALVQGSFLEGAPVVEVSARTGAGISRLKTVIQQVAHTVEPRPDRGVFRMPIDRRFTIKGFGTVVAGTILSGRCAVGDQLEILPQRRTVRVRGIQRHNQPVASIGVSERAALNLSGIEPEEIERGNVLATPGYYQPTTIINASLYLLTEVSQPLKNMARVHLHIGTAETMCRVCLLDTKELTPGTEGLVQLRTEEPVICDFNDRFVLRHYSPLITIGGGTVLEAQAKKEPRFEPALLARLAGLKSGEPGAVLEQMLIKSGFDVKTVAGIARELAVSERDVEVLLGHLLKQNKVRLIETEGKYYCIHNQILAAALNAVRDQLTDYHRQNPLRLGIKQSELRAKVKLPGVLFELVLSELSKGGEVVIEGERVRRAGHELKLTPEEKRIFEQVAQVFLSAKWAPPEPDKVFAGIDKKLTARITIALLESGILIDLGDGILMHTQAVQAAEQILGALFQHKPELSASEFRQALGTTRKFVIPLLNYFDSIGLTQRKGDVRILRQAKNMPEKV